MGESWPVWANPSVDEDTETEVEPVARESNHGEGMATDWASSESMLWLSRHDKTPSPDTTGRG
jgi:hypothetical protein